VGVEDAPADDPLAERWGLDVLALHEAV